MASVIIRTFNSAPTLDRAVASVRGQDVPCEVVVVDSGSSDGTVAQARELADKVVELAPGEFTFGRSLNRGADVSGAPVHVALSSHCVLPGADWVRAASDHLDRGALATCGSIVDGTNSPISEPVHADFAYLRDHPFWGFTNHASAWRADVWSRWPFDERLGASEDKEWSWRIAEGSGGYLVMDPALFVMSAHRRRKGVRPYFDRLTREVTSYHEILGLPPYSVGHALRDWSRRLPEDPFVLKGSRPFGRTRLVEVLARLRAPAASGDR